MLICHMLVQVRQRFAPELLNRMSEMVIFEPLSDDKLKEIVKIQMKAVAARVADKGISLHASDAALDVVFSESYEPVMSAAYFLESCTISLLFFDNNGFGVLYALVTI